MTDAYTVIADGRSRGLSERTIARQLGLRDGETAYGVARIDNGAIITQGAPTTKPAPKHRLIPDETMARARRLTAAADVLMRRLERSRDLADELEMAARKMRGLPALSERLTYDHILRAVCEAFGATENQIRGTSRSVVDTRPRFAFCELAARYVRGASLTKIGHYLDRDHTSVMNARRRVVDLHETDVAWRMKFDDALARLPK